jgi:DNA (cytosine-5)-methyltransferase 1
MRTAHLFAGAGGGILADLILGHTTVVAVEWDAYACAVLRRQFPSMRVIEGDVRSVDFAVELAGVDALCAGFPCTDISAANPNGKGIGGERSGLYREVMRAIDAVRPEWVFLENSPRIRTKGRHIVIGDLVARGYSWRDGVLGAADVGAPHQRDRWWLLAHRDRDEPQAGLPVNGGRIEPGDSPAGDGCANMANANGVIGGPWRTGDADESTRGRDADGGGQREGHMADAGRDGPQDSVQGGVTHETEGDQIEAAARCDQRPGWWEAEPPMGRVVDGLAAGAHGNWAGRIRCLGNGQVPLAAAVAWRLLGGP